MALWVLAIVPFIPALSAGTTWDEDFLTASPILEDPGGLATIWTEPDAIPHEEHYWPLFYSTFWVETQLFGRDLQVFHLTNVLLHALAAWLLWRVLVRLRLRAAWLAAALFAVHPLHVESVAWIIERKDVLAACFYLGSAVLFLRGIDELRPGLRWGALLLLAAGLLCKSIVVTLPFALAIALYYAKGSVSKRDWRALTPLLLLAVAGAVFDAWYSSGQSSFESVYPLGERIAVAGQALWFYFAKTLVPVGQMPFYPRFGDPVSGALGGGMLGWIAVAAAVAAPLLLFALRKRWGRGPLAAALFFGIALAPMLGLVEFSFYATIASVADRFAYLASIAPLCLLASLLMGLRARFDGRASVLVGLVPLVLLSAATWRLSGKYEDLATFADFALEQNPNSWAPCSLRAWQHAQDGEHADAERLYSASLALRPGFADSLLGVGLAQLSQGRMSDAERSFRAALEAAPDSARANHLLGRLLYQRQQLNEALVLLERAFELSPGSAPICSTLGQLYAARGDFKRSVTLLERAVAIDPSDEPTRRALELARKFAEQRY